MDPAGWALASERENTPKPLRNLKKEGQRVVGEEDKVIQKPLEMKTAMQWQRVAGTPLA